MEASGRTHAQQSRSAIERIYIVMRHLLNRGKYKPLGVSGEELRSALLTLSPEIYGSIGDEERVELEGLLYVIERLPKGIEECRFIKLVSDEGLRESQFEIIVPAKRRRNCYRIDQEQMFIEMTRGRSDIYDILTHLTFMFNEAEKIRIKVIDSKGNLSRDWLKLDEFIQLEVEKQDENEEKAYTYLSALLGRTFDEVKAAKVSFAANGRHYNLFHIVYWLGKLSIDELQAKRSREISFSSTLRERIGHHIYGERWAQHIKSFLYQNGLFNRPVHIISSNLHSVMNVLYAWPALKKNNYLDFISMMEELSVDKDPVRQEEIRQYANRNGMFTISDMTSTNITVQVFDTARLQTAKLPSFLQNAKPNTSKDSPVILVMDYAFGEQAYEVMDELLKPFKYKESKFSMNVISISIMGKAGILNGEKGDLMIPTAYVFEGTADNYPIENHISAGDFKNTNLDVYEGTMITVLGTSLQNKDVLEYFKNSSWHAIGLEMEGAHLQKAIQAAAKIRNSISSKVEINCAYYASDNPLISGSTLASGSLGLIGVKPTYLITIRFLERILGGL